MRSNRSTDGYKLELQPDTADRQQPSLEDDYIDEDEEEEEEEEEEYSEEQDQSSNDKSSPEYDNEDEDSRANATDKYATRDGAMQDN